MFFDDDVVASRPPLPVDAPYSVFIHGDVLDTLRAGGAARLNRRAHLLVRHLMCTGKTSQVKGVTGPNQGWRRSNLGGNGGKQWYLWWTIKGSRPLHGLDDFDAIDGERPIFVRAVRHHDETSDLLAAGAADDYLPLQPVDMVQEREGFTSPWTEQQLAVAREKAPVKLIQGYPGAGKTTALWETICRREGEQVLYLTWSPRLTEAAEQHFRAFCPRTTAVQVHTWSWLLELLAGTAGDLDLDLDLEWGGDAGTPEGQRDRFKAACQKLPSGVMGPWRGHIDALYGELRAYLLGSALPTEPKQLVKAGQPRLSDKAYRALRESTLDAVSVGMANLVASGLDNGEKQGDGLAAFFPAVARAGRACARLLNDDIPLPPQLLKLDRVAVDEVQDLTLIEICVVALLVERLGRDRANNKKTARAAPFLLLAGDEGQTVRPTGFDWGRTKRLLSARLQVNPWAITLQANVRCPEHIAGVVNDLAEVYDELTRAAKPKDLRQVTIEQCTQGRIYHVIADGSSADAYADALRQLAAAPDVALISPKTPRPPQSTKICGEALLTPADVKGLDFQTVVVLDAGATLAEIRAEAAKSRDNADPITALWCRTAIDQLRVALSRATETLVFLERTPSQQARDELDKLISRRAPIPKQIGELTATLVGDEPLSERVQRSAARALEFLDSKPRFAQQRALEAVRSLGERPSLPGAIPDAALRAEVVEVCLRVALRSACSSAGCPRDLVEAVDVFAHELSVKGGATLLHALCSGSQDGRRRQASRQRPDAAWLVGVAQAARRATNPPIWLSQLLDEEGARWDAAYAKLLDGLGDQAVPAARELPAFYAARARPDADEAVRARRLILAERLLDAKGRGRDARAVVELVATPPAELEGRSLEAIDDNQAAIVVYRRAGLWPQMLDCARRHDGLEREAVEAAKHNPDLPAAKAARWTHELRLKLFERPNVELTEAERRAIRLALPDWAKAGRP